MTASVHDSRQACLEMGILAPQQDVFLAQLAELLLPLGLAKGDKGRGGVGKLAERRRDPLNGSDDGAEHQ
jgi:hypothetical protein